MIEFLLYVYQELETKCTNELEKARNLDNSFVHQLTILAGFITYFLVIREDIILIFDTTLHSIISTSFILCMLSIGIVMYYTIAQIKHACKKLIFNLNNNYDMFYDVSYKYLSNPKICSYLIDNIKLSSNILSTLSVFNNIRIEKVKDTWKAIEITAYLFSLHFVLYLIKKG